MQRQSFAFPFHSRSQNISFLIMILCYFLFSFLICDSIFCCQTIFLHRSRGEQLTLAENNDKHYHSIPDDCSLSDISTQLRGRYDSHRDIFSLFLLRNLQF